MIQDPPTIELSGVCPDVETASATSLLTFCNPLNLDYGPEGSDHRHGADPVIVLFKERYYLFSTLDVPGFRVSDDLREWRTIHFPPDVAAAATKDGYYIAAAAAAQGDWLYFVNMIAPEGQTLCPILRTHDPLAGEWEKCGEIREAGDPTLFFDDDGRAFLYYGLGGPSRVFEIDTQNWTEIADSDRLLRPEIEKISDFYGGYERGRRELGGEEDTREWLDKFEMLPCQEANWMTKHEGRYYLQYSTPGTQSQWYCDTVLEGNSPVGPFLHVDYAPVSFKVGGFIGSAGHSCVFADKFGNLWRATTMWVGVHQAFERRLGLFPVGFDAQGRMFTQTALGDYPQTLPQGLRDEKTSPLAGWWLLSLGKQCIASSALENHPPHLAANEDVRSWWSAQTGNEGEWLQMDLGKSCPVHAVQINFAEQEYQTAIARLGEDAHRYRLLGSCNGKGWQLLLDRSQSEMATPHDYVAFAAPQTLRYFKIENVFTPGNGKFALRGLRVFGQGAGAPPTAPRDLHVLRHPDDERNATAVWHPVPDADGYLVRFGVAPDALFQTIQVQSDVDCLTTHVLNRGAHYFWRVDAFNDSGLTIGETIVATPPFSSSNFAPIDPENEVHSTPD